ncbi:MAG: TonB-dependent receptor [Alistipes sp.]|nr:TonB-dependent receptor [Alistipes sp.]
MKIKSLLVFILLCVVSVANAQKLRGVVREGGEPLVGAVVNWQGTTVGAVCDAEGKFEIHRVKGNNQLVASYVGYEEEVVTVGEGQNYVEITMSSSVELEEVVVESSLGNYVKREGVLKGETISFAGLCKMACCNLAESFENSASVTVGYSDAISGARQIKMLGLTGTYTQMLDENRPIMKGLGSPYGLNYTPGMWLNSIQVSKGVASVTAGHEAITGQINLEHRKPTDEERLFVNLYFDSELRPEINLSSAIPLTEDKRLSTVILLHGSMDTKSHDMNDDGFRDLPKTNQINIANKWLYQAPKSGAQIRWGWKVVDENRLGGQMDYRTSLYDKMMQDLSIYGSKMDNTNVNAYFKIGVPVGASVWDAESEEELRSNVAFVLDYNYFNEDAYFGVKSYDGHDNQWWANLMYAHYFSTRSSMVFGASAQLTSQSEDVMDSVVRPLTPGASADASMSISTLPYYNDMRYFEPGVYAEYTYNIKDKFTLVLGVRGDWMGAENYNKHDLLLNGGLTSGATHQPKERFVVTPRSHIKVDITPTTVLRASAGLGYRRTNLITDNIWMLATNRSIYSSVDDDIEMALTAGGSLTQYFSLLGYENATLSFDYFRTQFYNTVVADQEFADPHIMLYNTDNRSYTDTYQVDFQWTPTVGLDVFATFRYTNSSISLMRDGQPVEIERPLTSRYKTLLNIQYATPYRRWVFDVTAQYNGPMRLPSLDGDLSNHRLSPAYPMFYAQVSHKFRGGLELYVGCENIANYMQDDPIISAMVPFSPEFNSSCVWGPLMGRKFYMGLRFNLY